MALLQMLQVVRRCLKLFQGCKRIWAYLCGPFQPEPSMRLVEHLLLCASVNPGSCLVACRLMQVRPLMFVWASEWNSGTMVMCSAKAMIPLACFTNICTCRVSCRPAQAPKPAAQSVGVKSTLMQQNGAGFTVCYRHHTGATVDSQGMSQVCASVVRQGRQRRISTSSTESSPGGHSG